MSRAVAGTSARRVVISITALFVLAPILLITYQSFLTAPFFDPKADPAVNYGGIGGVIGHEMSHGFDDQGRKSDGTGRLQDWWPARRR